MDIIVQPLTINKPGQTEQPTPPCCQDDHPVMKNKPSHDDQPSRPSLYGRLTTPPPAPRPQAKPTCPEETRPANSSKGPPSNKVARAGPTPPQPVMSGETQTAPKACHEMEISLNAFPRPPLNLTPSPNMEKFEEKISTPKIIFLPTSTPQRKEN